MSKCFDDPRLQNGSKEGNVLFNEALNTFYLWLYGVIHMVKDRSDFEGGNPLPPHGLLFPISSKGSFICTIPQTDYRMCVWECRTCMKTVNMMTNSVEVTNILFIGISSSLRRATREKHTAPRRPPYAWS